MTVIDTAGSLKTILMWTGLIEPTETIDEHDVETEGIWTQQDIQDAEEYEQALKEYWDEVRECCGGSDWTCGHYRHYPPLMEERDY